MTTNPKIQKMLQVVGAWARGQGIPRPKTKEEWAHLLALYFQANQAAWHEIPDDHVTHMVNDGATVQIVDAKPEGVFEDDWDRLMRDRAAAAVGPNGELLDDFDQEFQLGQAKAAESAAVSPPTNTNPVSAQNAILGGQSTPDSRQQPVEVARWNGDNDAECTNFTVTAALVKPPLSQQNFNVSYRGYLVVQWGIRGYTFNIEVDIGQGVEFTLTGSFCSVQIFCEASVASNVGPPYTAGVSFREANRTAPLTRSKTGLLKTAGAGSTSIIVPPFAKKFWVLSTDTTQTYTVTIQEPDATSITSFVIPANTLPTTSYILPASAAFVVVASGTSSVLGSVVFELDV